MKIDFVESVDSTNSHIWTISRLEKEPIAVIARSQSKGRGTKGRKWISESGNFYGSFLQSFEVDQVKLDQVSMLVGIRVARILESLCLNNIKILWPNDLVIDLGNHYLKVGGILCESKIKGNWIDLVMGIGVNFYHAPAVTEKPSGKIPGNLQEFTSGLIEAFRNPIFDEDIKNYQDFDFLHGKGILLRNGKLGIGKGISFNGPSYEVEDRDGIIHEIMDPDRPKLIGIN